jgi:hypothetical protein
VLLLRLHGGEHRTGVVGCVAQCLALHRPNSRNITLDNISGQDVSSVAVKKGYDHGAGIEAVLVHAPRLQRAAGHVKPLDRLTLRDSLGVQSTI